MGSDGTDSEASRVISEPMQARANLCTEGSNLGMEWEDLGTMGRPTDVLQRVPVAGGWLYRNVVVEETRADVWETRISLCFVPARKRGRGTAERSASLRASVA